MLNKNLALVRVSRNNKKTRTKAKDYVVKRETAFISLQKIITNVFRMKKIEKELSWYMDRM